MPRRRKQVNKEYYQAKADLCRDLAIKQMVEGEHKEAGANLIRMVNALNELNLINYKEEKDKPCAECGFYEWDVDSAPLENCSTCGRERV
jgi:hypothetical protein